MISDFSRWLRDSSSAQEYLLEYDTVRAISVLLQRYDLIHDSSVGNPASATHVLYAQVPYPEGDCGTMYRYSTSHMAPPVDDAKVSAATLLYPCVSARCGPHCPKSHDT
jgi:hypothetical protein